MSDELRIDCVESGEARRNTPFSPSVPLSVRRQEALFRNMDSPRIDEPSTSSGASTPSRKRLPLALRKNEKGETSLHTAARKGDVALCESLIAQGAVVNEADNAGWLPLHEACGRNQYEVAEFLVRNGADVNSNSNTNGDTPLHDACAVKNARLIELLLRNGADRTIRNRKNLLAMDLLEGHVDGLRVFDLDLSSSASSSSSTTSTSPEREDPEDDEEDTPVPACRSSALISSEQPKDDVESQPSSSTSSVSPQDTTFSISTPRRGAAARQKRATIREKAPARQTRKPRGAKKATAPTRRGAPRNAARRGGASSGVYYADEDESAPQGTSGVVVVSGASPVASTSYSAVSAVHSSARFLGRQFEDMSTTDESEKKRKEDVYEFRDDEEDDMPLARFDAPSTSSSSLVTFKRKLDETKQDDVMKKVPPLRITLKLSEDAPQPEVSPEETPKEVEEDDEIAVIVLDDKDDEEQVNQADVPSTSSGGDEGQGYGMRKNRGRPYKKPLNASAANPEDKRVTRSRGRQASENRVICFPHHKVRNRLRDSEYYISVPGETKEATATVLSDGVTASQIIPPRTRKLIPIPKPKLSKTVRHIYQGNPARSYYTMENLLRKKMTYEHEKGPEVPPRPYSYKEHNYLCNKEARDITFWRRMNESKPPPKPVPEDCPPELVELWKDIEEEQAKFLHEWYMEKQRAKSSIQHHYVLAREERWRHQHGDFTVKPSILTLLCRTFDPSMLERTEKKVEPETDEELEKFTADEIEKYRARQFCVARIIYNKHKTLWEMDCKRFRLPKSLYKRRLNYFVPNLVEMVTPLDPDL